MRQYLPMVLWQQYAPYHYNPRTGLHDVGGARAAISRPYHALKGISLPPEYEQAKNILLVHGSVKKAIEAYLQK